MPRRLLPFSVVLVAAACSGGLAHAAADVPTINCDGFFNRGPDLAPIGPGPLELAKIYCQRIRPGNNTAASISPDGRSIAYLEGSSSYVAERKVLHVAPLHMRDSWTDCQLNMGPLWHFSSGYRTVPAFGWASNSSSVWTATRETVGPEGLSKSGLQPALTVEDKSLQLLPPLRNEAGPLDGLLWVGGDGLAIAHFGARGQSYQPQRHDRTPTFAIVDAKRGLVLETLRFDATEVLKRSSYYITNLNGAAVTKLQNGKVRVLLSGYGQWALWTQGEPPRVVADPYPDERHVSKFTMSLDGSRVLVSRVACVGGFESIGDGRHGVTTCKPVESAIASLHDVETGQEIWSIRATVSRPSYAPTPAISDDGNYALVELPTTVPRPLIALISMSDGKIVQTLPSPGGGGLYSMGFLHGGRTVWTHGQGVTAFYDVRG